ncbi:hypothetical protein NC653_019356 [Populus alba x Populus x berolinensis]|uniref:Uncharacterized protein n=1 Tax=Populus alba x Populus x berolinensis TaxID=444605 RepID=A0AAD6QIN7_9ROSI|nr:hypothetical protein NC653_019356 [Populus alba x Populus x berolinensis]
MSGPRVHYEYHVELKPFQQELTKFPILFMLGELQYFTHITEGQRVFRRAREPIIIRKLARIPVGDSLFDHIQDFKDILTEMDIPEIEQSKILYKIASKANGMDTYCGAFMSVRIVKVIFRPDQSAVNNEEKDVAKAEGKVSDKQHPEDIASFGGCRLDTCGHLAAIIYVVNSDGYYSCS